MVWGGSVEGDGEVKGSCSVEEAAAASPSGLASSLPSLLTLPCAFSLSCGGVAAAAVAGGLADEEASMLPSPSAGATLCTSCSLILLFSSSALINIPASPPCVPVLLPLCSCISLNPSRNSNPLNLFTSLPLPNNAYTTFAFPLTSSSPLERIALHASSRKKQHRGLPSSARRKAGRLTCASNWPSLAALETPLDPGFGFGKNTRHNFDLLEGLSYLQQLGKPLMVGVSRKGMVYRTLGISAEEALNGTTVLHTISLLKGAQLLRVHDVTEAVQAVRLAGMLQTNAAQPG